MPGDTLTSTTVNDAVVAYLGAIGVTGVDDNTTYTAALTAFQDSADRFKSDESAHITAAAVLLKALGGQLS